MDDAIKAAPRPRARPTLADVARRCRLDKSTVSRILNRPADAFAYNAATRRRVCACAAEMGYRPNWRARALATGRTGAVGLCFSAARTLTRPMLSTETALAGELKTHGYHLQFIPLGDAPEEWNELVQSRRVDGFVVLNTAPRQFCQLLADADVPAVLINFDVGVALDTICLDDEQGARLATRHLIDLGHRDIAFLSWDYENLGRPHPSLTIRQRFYRETMVEAGLEPRVVCYPSPMQTAAERLLDGTPVTAAICYSHRDAIWLLNGLWRRRLRVPDDISVVGFNDVFPVECAIPPLTVVSTMEERMGRAGGRMLLERIRGEAHGAPRRLALPESLIVRESTARRQP